MIIDQYTANVGGKETLVIHIDTVGHTTGDVAQFLAQEISERRAAGWRRPSSTTLHLTGGSNQVLLTFCK